MSEEKKDTILVFGFNSFTGKHLQNYIKNQNLNISYSFVGVDRTSSEANENFNFEKIVEFNKSNIKSLMIKYQPSYIINLIGLYGIAEFEKFFEVNVVIAKHILQAIVDLKLEIKNILLIGSSAEYGEHKIVPIKETAETNPLNYYGLTKLIQTYLGKFYIEQHGLPICIARTFNVIGKGISDKLSVGAFLNQIKAAREYDTIETGNLDSKRDFLDIEDVVDAYWKLLIYGVPGIYNVCSGKSVLVRDILDMMIKQSKKNLKISVVESLIRDNDITDIYGDNSKIMTMLNWNYKINLETSIKNVVDL